MGVGWGLDQELQVTPSRANGCGMGKRGENRKWEDNTLLNRQRGGECGGGDVCVRTGAQARSWSADTRVRRQLTLYLVLRQGLSWFLPFLLILRASWPPGLLCTSVSTSHLTLPHTALYVTSESQTVAVTLVQQGFHPLNHFFQPVT